MSFEEFKINGDFSEQDQRKWLRAQIENYDNPQAIMNAALISSAFLMKYFEEKEIPFIGFGCKVPSDVVRALYGPERDQKPEYTEIKLREISDPRFSQCPPVVLRELKKHLKESSDSHSRVFVRFTLVEQPDQNNRPRIFAKTGSHVTFGVFDFTCPKVTFYYYCAIGSKCPIDIKDLLINAQALKETDDIVMIQSQRNDQKRHQDGLCAVFTHSMIIAVEKVLHENINQIEKESFPENTIQIAQYRMMESVMSSTDVRARIDQELKK